MLLSNINIYSFHFDFSSLQVLLKRYLSSQAFINVAAALAQYFRRRVSGRPVWLDIPSLTEHIQDWMLEEVQNIASMNKEALEHVFSYMWKFNKRWCSVLNPPLPCDLESLKVGIVKKSNTVHQVVLLGHGEFPVSTA